MKSAWNISALITIITVLIATPPVALAQTVEVQIVADATTAATLANPEGLFYDANDHLYVADTGNNRLVEFAADLTFIRTIGEAGNGNGQFNKPVDVALDSKGRIIVADSVNHRIQIFDGKGTFLLAFGSNGAEDGQFNRPANVTIDDRDNIIVTDRHNYRLQVFDRAGKHLFTLSNRTGKKSAERIELEKKWAIDRDPKKKPEDIKVNPDWKKTDAGQFNEPGGTWHDAKSKELWVANGWNCRYERFDYDSRTGTISRKANEDVNGRVWGPWLTRNCTGTPDGNFIGLQTVWGGLQFFYNRVELTALSKIDKNIGGGSYGNMKQVHDIEINSKGEVAVADTHNSRIVIFNKDFTMPPSPSVPWLTRDGGKITWRTAVPSPSELMLRRGDLPERTPGREHPWTDGQDNITIVRISQRPVHAHEAILTGLEPGTRYYYKLRIPGMKTVPGAGWSREYAFATHAKEGETVFLAFTLKTLLRPNMIDVETVRPDTAFPEPMSKSDLKRYYEDQFRQTDLFYWINSRMKYWIDHDIYVDETMVRMGDIEKGQFKDDAEKAKYAALAAPNRGKSLQTLIAEAGNQDKIYFGQMIVQCKRRWNEGQKKWDYQGSGGGTYGVEWPVPGRSNFLGGSDVAWLMCHEYKHQAESNFGGSGLDKPEDRMWFCHFSPTYPGWAHPSADDHGEHWDGIAWQLRHHKPDSYLRSMFSILHTAPDADGDGIPDDDPRVPLDEKRLGSSPASQDTDGDGLHDMDELLASTWVRALNAAVRVRTEVNYIRPDLNNPDSDGDGIIDGLDKYPIYPYTPEIPKGTATVDGELDEWTGKPQIKFTAEGVTIEVWSRWNNTNKKPHEELDETDALFYAVRMTGDWSSLSLVLDLDANGFYYGNDNLYIQIAPDKNAGPKMSNARMHMCDLGRWPWFDGQHTYLKPDEIRFAAMATADAQVFELAVPRRDVLGLHLKRGEEIGLMLYIGLPGKGPVAVFEPWDIFDSTLVE